MTVEMTLDFTQLPTGQFINNEWVAGKGDASLNIINPANGDTLADISTAGESDLTDAINSAAAGFEIWSQTPASERSKILNKVAELLRMYNDPLALLETRNTGKPIQESSVVDVISGAECFEFFAACTHHLNGQSIPDPNALIYTRREPLGIVAAIGAWNYPMQIACWKSAPALACGNSVIFKPSELTPLTAQYLAEIFKMAGLPAGVFNIIHGDGGIGQKLVEHPQVSKISLTGSVPTGRSVLRSAAENLTPVTLELGGKSPFIVFNNADLENAVTGALMANFYTQGEICSNGTRIFVQADIYDSFMTAFVARAQNIILGDPADPKTQMGPLINRTHAERVRNYIQHGIEGGATLACGNAPDRGATDNYIGPTIFTECTDDMKIVRDEIFGPVACVLPFETEEEVIQRANKTPFGLAAGVFTQDITLAHRVVSKLKAGVCWINDYNITPIAMPFGGIKASGIGRENGLAALDHYTQLKSVYLGMHPVASDYA
jgi:betaine-aldehyde dehydrogenase